MAARNSCYSNSDRKWAMGWGLQNRYISAIGRRGIAATQQKMQGAALWMTNAKLSQKGIARL
jgi:hypothetical protein